MSSVSIFGNDSALVSSTTKENVIRRERESEKEEKCSFHYLKRDKIYIFNKPPNDNIVILMGIV